MKVIKTISLDEESHKIIMQLPEDFNFSGWVSKQVKIRLTPLSYLIKKRDQLNEQIKTLKEGENSFNIIVQNKAGNRTEKEIKVNYSP